jgi:putative pyoverdin transport system ATP-binding/permease protein
MNIIWLLLKASWLNVLIAITTGLISGGCSAQLIALINQSIQSRSPDVFFQPFTLVALVGLVSSIISHILLFKIAQDTVYGLRLRMSRSILSAPLQRLEELGANRLLATLTEDVQTLSNAVSAAPFVCIDIAIIIGCLTYLGVLSGRAFLLTSLLMFGAIVSVQLLLNRAYGYFERARYVDDHLFRHFRGITDGVKELKLNHDRREAFFTDELQVTAGRSRHFNLQALKAMAIASAWGQLVFFAIVGLFIFGVPKFVQITPATLSSYILTLTYLISPFQGILQALPGFLTASVALRKVEAMGLVLAERQEQFLTKAAIATIRPSWSSLELRHLRHTYRSEPVQAETSWEASAPQRSKQGKRAQKKQAKAKAMAQSTQLLASSEPSSSSASASTVPAQSNAQSNSSPPIETQFTLGEINLSFQSNQIIFIVGGNGSGKSTLAKLLTGLYIPDDGEIWLDGQRVTDENREWYRQHFASVFVDFYLFERLLGIEASEVDRQGAYYLEKLQLDHKVKIEKAQLSTTALSQGQRKRLALLTAYLEDRPIYFFDEWASDQDPYFRDIFYHQLLPELKRRGKTIFVISHDDRYFDVGDRIIKLDYGKVESDKIIPS